MVVSTLNAPCIFRNFIGFIALELPPAPLPPPMMEGGGGGGAERGSLPSRAVRLDLLLGLKVGGNGVEGLLLKKEGRGEDGAAWLVVVDGEDGRAGSGADWFSRC